jgi:hypothetical protein
MNYVSFPYQQIKEDLWMPYAWVRLSFGRSYWDDWALIDSGAEVNVIPYKVGIGLGLSWDDWENGPTVGGSAAGQTKTVELTVNIGTFAQVPLTFCWFNHDKVKILFGQQNFFENFAVYFDWKRQEFKLLQYTE